MKINNIGILAFVVMLLGSILIIIGLTTPDYLGWFYSGDGTRVFQTGMVIWAIGLVMWFGSYAWRMNIGKCKVCGNDLRPFEVYGDVTKPFTNYCQRCHYTKLRDAAAEDLIFWNNQIRLIEEKGEG